MGFITKGGHLGEAKVVCIQRQGAHHSEVGVVLELETDGLLLRDELRPRPIQGEVSRQRDGDGFGGPVCAGGYLETACEQKLTVVVV